MKDSSQLNLIASIILDSAIAVHKEMGPGLLECVYQHCLVKELFSRNVKVTQWCLFRCITKAKRLEKDYVIDILVEDEIILELKAVEGLLPVHEAQLISYLKLANKRLGVLINFNVPLLKQGFRRYVNHL